MCDCMQKLTDRGGHARVGRILPTMTDAVVFLCPRASGVGGLEYVVRVGVQGDERR